MPLLRTCVLFVGLVLAPAACASDCVPRWQEGWIRLTPARMPMLGGFGRIANACPRAVTVVGASSPDFGEVSLHETRLVDGISRMRPVSELVIPANGAVEFAPGGLHLMLMTPRAPLEPGQRVPIEFRLKDGGVLRGELEARTAAP